MAIEVTTTQLSNTAVECLWSTTDGDSVGGWQVRRADDAGPLTLIGQVFNPAGRSYIDLTPPAAGVVAEYHITDVDTTFFGVGTITLADLDVPYTFGTVDPLVDVPRYTTLDDVKQRLGITNAESDDLITQSIVGAEVAMDQINGRSFPDTGTNPEIPGIPSAISAWATDASIAVWKATDAPFGQGGGDAWLGSLDIQGITERVLRRHPLALGYQVSWGVS